MRTTHWLAVAVHAIALAACDHHEDDPEHQDDPLQKTVSACYSPTQHLDIAYESGSMGCACTDDDADQCIAGVALICSEGQWQAVEDGPCAPPAPSFCYSPSSNLLRAYEAGAVGCACSEGDLSGCYAGVGLECVAGTWRTNADGPCVHGAPSCISPSQNTELAIQQLLGTPGKPRPYGCPCTEGVPDQCVKGLGYSCSGGFWVVGFDGPCLPQR